MDDKLNIRELFSDKVLKDFRCANDNKLFVKAHVKSTMEGKCRKCNTISYSVQGTSYSVVKNKTNDDFKYLFCGSTTREFRCFVDNQLIVKTKVDSAIEGKCKNCNTVSYFILGTSYYIDQDNRTYEQLKGGVRK